MDSITGEGGADPAGKGHPVGAADAQLAVERATNVGWGYDVSSIASSPAVRVGETDHPAYLWVTTSSGILRLQP